MIDVPAVTPKFLSSNPSLSLIEYSDGYTAISMNPPTITKTQASEISAPLDSKRSHALMMASITHIDNPQLMIPVFVRVNLNSPPIDIPIRKVTITIKIEVTAPLQPTSAISLNWTRNPYKITASCIKVPLEKAIPGCIVFL